MKTTPNNDKEVVLSELGMAIEIQRHLDLLMNDKKFKLYLEQQKKMTEDLNDLWSRIETAMIDKNIKHLDGDWGWMTIAERVDFDVDMETLPKRFKKVVADTAKIRSITKLEGEPIKGTTAHTSKYLTKKIKLEA